VERERETSEIDKKRANQHSTNNKCTLAHASILNKQQRDLAAQIWWRRRRQANAEVQVVEVVGDVVGLDQDPDRQSQGSKQHDEDDDDGHADQTLLKRSGIGHWVRRHGVATWRTTHHRTTHHRAAHTGRTAHTGRAAHSGRAKARV
jgi:hypothetical protein